MTLERIGANHLLVQHASALDGLILDLGAGEDPYRALLRGRVVSVDITAALTPQVVGDAHALPFRDAVFDAVVASQVFEHLHSPWLAAAELARVLKPGGTALVAVPFLFWLHQRPHDYYRYTEYGLRKLFEPHFEIARLTPYGGKLAAGVEMLLNSTPASTRPRRAVRALRRRTLGLGLEVQRPRLARLLLRRPGDHPLGYVLVLRRSRVRDPARLTASTD